MKMKNSESYMKTSSRRSINKTQTERNRKPALNRTQEEANVERVKETQGQEEQTTRKVTITTRNLFFFTR